MSLPILSDTISGKMKTNIYSDGKLTTDQNKDITKVQLRESMKFDCFGYLQQHGKGVTYRTYKRRV